MYKFMRINKYTTAYGDPHLQLTSAANLGKNDVAVAISWSGETKDTLMAARLAKESGAAVISITRYGNTSLESFSDIHFGLSAPEATIRCGATSSRMAQLNMVDMLFYCIVNQHYMGASKVFGSLPSGCEKQEKRVVRNAPVYMRISPSCNEMPLDAEKQCSASRGHFA